MSHPDVLRGHSLHNHQSQVCLVKPQRTDHHVHSLLGHLHRHRHLHHMRHRLHLHSRLQPPVPHELPQLKQGPNVTALVVLRTAQGQQGAPLVLPMLAACPHLSQMQRHHVGARLRQGEIHLRHPHMHGRNMKMKMMATGGGANPLRHRGLRLLQMQLPLEHPSALHGLQRAMVGPPQMWTKLLRDHDLLQCQRVIKEAQKRQVLGQVCTQAQRLELPPGDPQQQVPAVLHLLGQHQITAALRSVVAVQAAIRHVAHHENLQQQDFRNHLVPVYRDSIQCESSNCRL